MILTSKRSIRLSPFQYPAKLFPIWKLLVTLYPIMMFPGLGFVSTGQPMDLHRFWGGVITSSQNLTRLRNEATVLRSRQKFQRSQLTELASTEFESWAKESYEIATKIAYQNGRLIGSPRDRNKDCMTVAATPALPVGYVANSSRIADRRMVLAGYRLADLLMRLTES